MKTREKIIKYIKEKGHATGAELANVFEISDRGVRKQLANMLENGELIKNGRPPKVFYALKEKEPAPVNYKVESETKKVIDKNYFIITPGGEKMEGFAGFVYWCEKQSQNKRLMKELIDDIRPAIGKIMKKFSIDGVGFVQPTVKREVQFMNELKKNLNLKVKEIIITKIKTDIIIPQKTLNKLNDRIENAQKTFVIEELGHFNNILLIDDAVGSGATLNEIAKKIKNKGITKKVIGLAITGSFKGFDVISEV